jgi:hypothetical protein
MRNTLISAVAFVTISIPLSAAKPPATAKGPSVKSVKAAKASTPKSPSAAAHAKSGKPATAGKAVKPPKSSSTTAAGTSTTAPAPATTTTSGGGTSSTWKPTNPISQKLSTKPNLMARATKSLPPGTDLNAATAGFKNFGQFVAATNVSTNLGIDFGTLKAAMTGTDLTGASTGQPTSSLGQAIHRLKPGVDATAEATHAETQANQQINANQ